MYGTAIHGALDHYFSRKISGIAPTLKQLIEDYNQAFRNVGFITREQEEKRHQAGIESLTRFYKEDLKNPIFPKKVEERFEFCEENIKIRGRYDLVCKNSLTDEIIDFKTSRVILQKDADRRIKQSSQMMVYALAWWKKYNVIPVTTLHFIESGLKGQITFKQKDLEKTAEMVKDVAEGIKKADFSASPSQFECRQCPYKDICNEAKI
jgi:DNA helicase-2/ATP-dependent DNA helicase PcrA